jgi:hypothetical protein
MPFTITRSCDGCAIGRWFGVVTSPQLFKIPVLEGEIAKKWVYFKNRPKLAPKSADYKLPTRIRASKLIMD